MSKFRHLPLLATLAIVASPVAAQQPGSLLLGGFGQYTKYGADVGSASNTSGVDNLWGGGVRVGAFITPRWNVEAEGSMSQYKDIAGSSDVQYRATPLVARLVYNMPIYSHTKLLLGAGAVASQGNLRRVAGGESSEMTGPTESRYGANGDIGLRVGLTDWMGLRADALVDYLPSRSNRTMMDLNGNLVAGDEPQQTNYRFQAGVDLMPNFSSWTGSGNSAYMGPVALWNEQAQPTPGTVELGGFGQYTWFDQSRDAQLGVANKFGGGGLLGVFLTPKWELQGDGSYTSTNANTYGSGSSNVTYTTSALRLNYNMPVLTNHSILVGVGGFRNTFTGVTRYGVSGDLGARIHLVNRVALRVDGLADYAPRNPNWVNYGARAGLSVMLGGATPTPVVVTPEQARPPEPTPLPITPVPAEPPPPPPPAPPVVVDTARLTASIYFDFDRSAIRTDAAMTLDRKIPFFQANPDLRIRIEGNTDERGSDEYNLSLGQRRAQSAKAYLVSHGVSADRIDIVSYGEERPVCAQHNEACWSQNRRDDFRILIGPSGELKMPQE